MSERRGLGRFPAVGLGPERRVRSRAAEGTRPEKHPLPPVVGHTAAEKRGVRIVIADDHALVLAGIERLLTSEPGFSVVGKATNAAQAVLLTRGLRPDVLLLDVSMPGESGLDVLEQIVSVPGVAVILLTAGVDETDRERAFRLGVRGVVLKDAASDVLFDSIRTVVAGQYWFWRASAAAPLEAGTGSAPPTPKPETAVPGSARSLTQREREVLAALVEGCTNREIAERLLISEDTVKHHLSHLFDKTGASSRVELAMFAVHRRLLDG